MIYNTSKDWLNAPHKRVALIGMSGLGKTYLSNLLRGCGDWFHYSVDYRIGTHYMGEHIVDNFKQEAMKVPFLAEHLRSDSIYIASNITFENLAPLSRYLGKPGNPDLGGIPFKTYMERQAQHSVAEIAATRDAVKFMEKSQNIYGYQNFICDTSGSICEVTDPSNPNDPTLKLLSENALIVWLKGNDAHTDTLVERFNKAPKPMFARAEVMTERWNRYLNDRGLEEASVDPDDFIRWSYRQMLDDRLPRYAAMAENWGVAIDADAFQGITEVAQFEQVIAEHLT